MQETPVRFRINEGMVPGMRVPGKFYVNDRLKSLIFDELHAATQRGGQGGFLPAIKQIANVAALPGIVRVGHSHFQHDRRHTSSVSLHAIASACITGIRLPCRRLQCLKG